MFHPNYDNEECFGNLQVPDPEQAALGGRSGAELSRQVPRTRFLLEIITHIPIQRIFVAHFTM
jgi:hypothetical protein